MNVFKPPWMLLCYCTEMFLITLLVKTWSLMNSSDTTLIAVCSQASYITPLYLRFLILQSEDTFKSDLTGWVLNEITQVKFLIQEWTQNKYKIMLASTIIPQWRSNRESSPWRKQQWSSVGSAWTLMATPTFHFLLSFPPHQNLCGLSILQVSPRCL